MKKKNSSASKQATLNPTILPNLPLITPTPASEQIQPRGARPPGAAARGRVASRAPRARGPRDEGEARQRPAREHNRQRGDDKRAEPQARAREDDARRGEQEAHARVGLADRQLQSHTGREAPVGGRVRGAEEQEGGDRPVGGADHRDHTVGVRREGRERIPAGWWGFVLVVVLWGGLWL